MVCRLLRIWPCSPSCICEWLAVLTGPAVHSDEDRWPTWGVGLPLLPTVSVSIIIWGLSWCLIHRHGIAHNRAIDSGTHFTGTKLWEKNLWLWGSLLVAHNTPSRGSWPWECWKSLLQVHNLVASLREIPWQDGVWSFIKSETSTMLLFLHFWGYDR